MRAAARAWRTGVRERPVGEADAADEAATSAGPSRVPSPAYTLRLELAHADGKFSDEERQHLKRTFVRHFELDGITSAERRLAETERTEPLDHVQTAKSRSGGRL